MSLSAFTSSYIGILIVQTIGFAAMFLGVTSFQRKKRGGIIAFQMISSTLWAIQLFLLGGYTGALQNALAVGRGAVFSAKEKRKWASSILVLLFFELLFIGAGIITFRIEGLWSILPTVAMLIQSVALFFNNENMMRRLSLFVSPLWLIYDIHTGTIAGILCESFVICSIIIALIRFREKSDYNKKVE